VGDYRIVGCDEASAGLSRRAEQERARVSALAGVLDGQPGADAEPAEGAAEAATPVPSGPLDAAVRSAAGSRRGGGRSLVAVVFASRWLEVVGHATTTAAAPAERAGRIRRRPWWR